MKGVKFKATFILLKKIKINPIFIMISFGGGGGELFSAMFLYHENYKC